jgi:hypothetical protein
VNAGYCPTAKDGVDNRVRLPHVALAPPDRQFVGITDVQDLGPVSAHALLEAEWKTHAGFLSQAAVLNGSREIVSKLTTNKPGVIRQHFRNRVVDEDAQAIMEILLKRKNSSVQ